MSRTTHVHSQRSVAALIGAAALILAVVSPASAAIPLQIGSDPFTQGTCHGSATSNHHANVEPDSFSNGSTIVAAY